MTFAALGQVRADDQLRMARSLGYGPVCAWLKVVLPRVYPQIRLPVYAVLAYSLSVVDMAIVLGPTTPPTLAPAGAALVQRSRPRDALSGRRRAPVCSSRSWWRRSACGAASRSRSPGSPGRGWSAAGAAAAAGRPRVAAWSGIAAADRPGARQRAQPRRLVGGGRVAVSAMPGRRRCRSTAGREPAAPRGAARLDHARDRARDHAGGAAPGRWLPREREPAAPSPGPRRADPDLSAAAGRRRSASCSASSCCWSGSGSTARMSGSSGRISCSCCPTCS